MYKRVLVPLDGSPEAAQALPYARVVADCMRAEIELLEAVPSLAEIMRGFSTSESQWRFSYDDWGNTQQRFSLAAETRLTDAASKLGELAARTTVTVAEGNPAEAIIAEAAKVPDTLITMSTHGRSGIRRWAMGSIADKVVRMAHHPTLLMRSREQTVPDVQIQGIFLPLDGSTFSEASIPHAVEVARAMGVGIEVLHVVAPVAFTPPARYGPLLVDQRQRQVALRGSLYVSGVAERLRASGVADATGTSICTDDAAGAILDTASDGKQRMIVMTTHGRSGLQRALVGSVADRVVRNSVRPVLLIRPTDESATEKDTP